MKYALAATTTTTTTTTPTPAPPPTKMITVYSPFSSAYWTITVYRCPGHHFGLRLFPKWLGLYRILGLTV